MKKTCFFIGPIGDDKTPIRDWSDQVLKYIVTPVVAELAYDNPRRSDLIARTGSISFEIMKRLVEDTLVIADLTESNPNVFYELAIRHALQKPVVHLIRKGDKIPFDLRDIRVIPVRIDDLREAESARQELKSQIVSSEEEGTTLIPYIAQIQQLKGVFESSKSDVEKETLLHLLERLENIQLSLGDVKNELVDLNSQFNNNVKREGPISSTFVEKRLAKAELVKKQRGKKKK
jgi:hypothetical protein